MAKRIQKDEGPKWYTATMEPEAMAPGHPSARTIEVEATNEKEVEEALASKGWKWRRITISEGRCMARLPQNKDEDAERYHATLEAMLGRPIPPRHNSGPFPISYRATAEVKDSDTRKRWAEYLEQWSYGLSVSTIPHHLSVEAGGTIYLPARWVRDPERWEQCTGIVHTTLKQWRASRAHAAEHHKEGQTPEARELYTDALAAVKAFDALEGWTFPAFAGSLNLGRKPSPFDVPHPGLLDMATAHMVPVMHPDRDHLKLEWWRQLLAAWDGPANTKADTVEQLLDHHHLHGGRAEVFRALVKSTAKRLHAIKDTGSKGAEHWETLADALEQWLAKGSKVPASLENSGTYLQSPSRLHAHHTNEQTAMNDLLMKLHPSPEHVPILEATPCPDLNQYSRLEKKDELQARKEFDEMRKRVPGFAISDFPRAFLVPLKSTQERGAKYLVQEATTFQVFTIPAVWANKREAWDYVHQELTNPPPHKLPDPYVKPDGWIDPQYYDTKELEGWKYEEVAKRCAPDKDPSVYDLPNPRLYWLDGTLSRIHETWWPIWMRGEFKRMLWELFTDPKQLHTPKEQRLTAFLNHHRDNGDNPAALWAYVRELTFDKPPQYSGYLVDRLRHWVDQQSIDTRNASAPAKATTSAKSKPKRPTLADKLSQVPGAAERFMDLVVGAGLCDASGAWIAGNDTKGKGKLIAMWDAVVDARTLRVPGFDTDTALVAALKGHFKGLKGLERLDRVRGRYSYAERVEEYIADLSERK